MDHMKMWTKWQNSCKVRNYPFVFKMFAHGPQVEYGFNDIITMKDTPDAGALAPTRVNIVCVTTI